MDNEILSTLNEVKTILYIILVIVSIGVGGGLVLLIGVVKKMWSIRKNENFQAKAQELLDTGCFQELIEFATDFLNERPNHTYALWFLGKSYFCIEDFANAKVQFDKIDKTELDWRDIVQPYLDEIKETQD